MDKLKLIRDIVISGTLIFTACGGGGGNSDKNISDNQSFDNQNVINKKPIVYAGEDKKATINVPILIWGSANDSDGAISSLEWKKGDKVLSTTETLSYTPTELGIDILTLTATDDDGATASDSIKIEVVEYKVEDRYDEPLPF